MNQHIQRLQERIEPLRQQIINHQVYPAIRQIDDLRLFMAYHVYAVWDFMSLLKALQNNLTCTAIPWVPKGSGATRYLINEIVLGEESDVDMEGNRTSHFELYLEAMKQAGADYSHLTQFLDVLTQQGSLATAFQTASTPSSARHFVEHTFEVVASNKAHVQAAVFTFGREDLIPSMFLSLINDLQAQDPERMSLFKYYLERHIEVDGEHHSQLALTMTSQLCGEEDAFWQEAEQATLLSLQRRIELWDGALAEITRRRS